MKKIIMAALILAIFFSSPISTAFRSTSAAAPLTITSTSSSTNVGGYITTNTTWALVGSPYIVAGDVIVVPNVFLTIEPGVVVKFAAGTNLVIDGVLMGQGNSTHPITFTSNSTTPAPGDWGTIKFRDSSIDSACIIDYAIIEWANVGVSLESSSPTISDSVIRKNAYGISVRGVAGGDVGVGSTMIGPKVAISNNTNGAIFHGANEMTLVLLDSELSFNGGPGIWTPGYLGGGWVGYSGFVTHSKILNNSGNGLGIYWGRWTIQGTVISNNTGNGIDISGGYGYSQLKITNSQILNNNGNGIYRRTSVVDWDFPDTITFSTIAQNKQNGINYAASKGGFSTRYSNLFDNSLFDMRNAGSHNINATLNWWGTTNETLIKDHIYDYYDDYSLGTVFYTPYLTIPIVIGAPVASFFYAPSEPVVNETLTFDASSSYDPDGTIVSYAWDFGDGTTITETDPIATYSYTHAGSYTATLTVTDNDGLTDTSTKSISIGKLSSTISIEASPTTITIGESTVVIGSIRPIRVGATVTIWYRLIGGTWSALTNVLTDLNGQYSYAWMPSETGTYELKASWPGDEDTFAAESPIITTTVLGDTTAPIAFFTYTPTEPAVNEIVTFDASASTDNIGIVLYEWDFGDGTAATGMIVTHAYTEPGSYVVRVTVWDAAGNVDTIAATITVGKVLFIKLSGEFDYSLRETVRIKIVALVTDATTAEPISNADVTIQIYDDAGNLWISSTMVEKLPGTGIYEWQSSGTIRDLVLKKGIYLVRTQASYRGGPLAHDILLFHIDPPAEGTNEALYYIALTVFTLAGATGLVLKRRQIINKFRH